MDFVKELADAKARSAALYLQRMKLEEQKQQHQVYGQNLLNQGRAIDMDMLKLDGEIGLLEKLAKESNA